MYMFKQYNQPEKYLDAQIITVCILNKRIMNENMNIKCNTLLSYFEVQ